MILNLATLMLVALKLMGYLDWSWWLVFAPSMVFVAILFLFPLVMCSWGLKAMRG